MDTTAAHDLSATPEAPAKDAGLTGGPAPAAGIEPPRLLRLFRHTVRVGGVNPLLHLMQRFRKEPAP